jgi:hypothetical protein
VGTGDQLLEPVPVAGRSAGQAEARNLRPPSAAEVTPAAIIDLTAQTTRRRRVLGRLINDYERAA